MRFGVAPDPAIVPSMQGLGAGNPIWPAVECGDTAKVYEFVVDLVVFSRATESDVPAQIAQLEDQLARWADRIVLAPTGLNALAPMVNESITDGVAVVFVKSKGANEGVT